MNYKLDHTGKLTVTFSPERKNEAVAFLKGVRVRDAVNQLHLDELICALGGCPNSIDGVSFI